MAVLTAASHLDGLLTPSRDFWEATLFQEILGVLEEHADDDAAAALKILLIMDRERTRHIAEER